jgi:hypothetical protein
MPRRIQTEETSYLKSALQQFDHQLDQTDFEASQCTEQNVFPVDAAEHDMALLQS